MKCIECGHELKDGAIFCIRCGAMQVSMDGKPIERQASQDWPDVEPQAGQAGWVAAESGRPSVNQRSRDFDTGPQRSGGKVAAIIVALIAVIAVIAFAAVSCMGPATSGSDSAASQDSAASGSVAGALASSSASASASSASASASSASASSASAASGSAASASTSTSSNNEPTPEIVNEPAPQQETNYTPAPAAPNNYYVLSDSSSYYYSYNELNSMSTYDLYLARNEIYARHGRMFNRSDLQDYFNSQSWYTPLYSPATFDSMGNQLNDCELKNVKLMKQVEADKGSPYL